MHNWFPPFDLVTGLCTTVALFNVLLTQSNLLWHKTTISSYTNDQIHHPLGTHRSICQCWLSQYPTQVHPKLLLTKVVVSFHYNETTSMKLLLFFFKVISPQSLVKYFFFTSQNCVHYITKLYLFSSYFIFYNKSLHKTTLHPSLQTTDSSLQTLILLYKLTNLQIHIISGSCSSHFHALYHTRLLHCFTVT